MKNRRGGKRQKGVHFLSTLLKFKEKAGKRKFKLKAAELSTQDIKHLAKVANDRLYKLEKAGLSGASRAYQSVMKYAVNGFNNQYNVNLNNSTVRFTRDIKRVKDKNKFIESLRQFLTNTTSTKGGTNKAIDKAYETFKNRPDIKGKPINRETFVKLAKAYRTQLSQDAKDRLGSDIIVQLTKEVGDFDIPAGDVATLMRYAEQSESLEAYYTKISNEGWFSSI